MASKRSCEVGPGYKATCKQQGNDNLLLSMGDYVSLSLLCQCQHVLVQHSLLGLHDDVGMVPEARENTTKKEKN